MIIATSILGVSSVGLVLLIAAKIWEQQSGRLLFPKLREFVGEYAHRFLHALSKEMPRAFSRTSGLLARITRAHASLVVAHAWVRFETGLERLLDRLRGSHETLQNRGEASPFLKEVAAYKQLLSSEVEKEKEKEEKENV